MGNVVRLAFDGHHQLEKLDCAVQTIAARMKMAANPIGGLVFGSCANLEDPKLAEHLRQSASNLRHLADQMTLAAISIEVECRADIEASTA